MRGTWNRDFFRNDHPIVLELGCGKGEYTVGLAARFPEKNFIGLDLKGARLWRGCKTVEELKLANVAFVRTRVDHIEKFFGPGEVSEIWITFPDPQPSKERKRLTAPVFLDRYRNILIPGGIVHLKTDDTQLYTYTLEILGQIGSNILNRTDHLYGNEVPGEACSIQTHYENIWLEQGKNICYLQFQLS